MPEDVQRAISSVEVEQLFEGKGADRREVGVLVKVKTRLDYSINEMLEFEEQDRRDRWGLPPRLL
jgi:hypothetical protein